MATSDTASRTGHDLSRFASDMNESLFNSCASIVQQQPHDRERPGCLLDYSLLPDPSMIGGKPHSDKKGMPTPSESGPRSSTATHERRGETRWPSTEPAILTLRTVKREVEVRLVDLSESGLRIRLMEPVSVGEAVRVEFRNLEAFGEVRWCKQPHQPYYDAGIEIRILVQS